MATIYEVATRAGVSPATVSRVFNGVNVSQEKTERVLRAASDLEFTPNRAARALRAQRSEVIALIIPDIENPFFTALARGVGDIAESEGYSVVLCNTDGDPRKEAKFLDIAYSDNVAGVIIAASGDSTDFSALVRKGRSIVAVDREIIGQNIDAVLVNNRAGGEAATRALVDQGANRIACITGPRHVETAQQRVEGWQSAVKSLTNDFGDVCTSADYLRYADYRVAGGYEAMLGLLALPDPPDAVFVANNLMGVGVLTALAEVGKTPPDILVSVFGDLPFAEFIPTAITVIHVPARQLGSTAAKMLFERIHGYSAPARTAILDHNPRTVRAIAANGS